MIGQLFNNTKLLEKSLDATWLRGETISQNIANVDTPGYKRETVEFEKYLGDASQGKGVTGLRTDSRHIIIGNNNADNAEIKLVRDNTSLSTRLDGNNVDIDNEMASMAKNSIQYNTVTQNLAQKFKMLKYMISEGRA